MIPAQTHKLLHRFSATHTWVVKLWQPLLQHVAQLAVQLTEVRLKQRLVKHLGSETAAGESKTYKFVALGAAA
jgi:hypothetical protein